MSEKSESQHTPQNAETRLTFGVELEFILATSLETNPYPHTKDKRQIDQEEFSDEESINYDIFEKLKAVGIPAIVEIDTKRCTDEQYETCWVLKSDATVGEIQRVNDEKWDSRYEKNGMEMSSPPYYYDESAKAAVRMVLRTVTHTMVFDSLNFVTS
ncbi:hypothetical protein EYC80_010227 [Monilinia laxa]|uniref:Uncharacterized protein n=1 Tax=Monilinia laxa TaxID=61186 RepID=A0A5N6JLN6_MONLA|nr:hypothetical protein EYC80_010227 [Monilinia laxa]